MKISTIKLDKWYGGISDDVRQQTAESFSLSAHFDIFSSPIKMTPYRSNITNDTVNSTSSDMTQFYVRNFCVSPDTGYLYGLGRERVGSDKIRILVKTDPVGNGSNWAISASSTQSDNGTPYRNTFMPYKNYLWGIKAPNSGTTNKMDLWKYGDLTTGAKTMATISADALDNGGNLNTAQGIIGKDDCLYMPYGSKLCKVNTAASVTVAALTLPSVYTITALDLYQNYLAIACKPRTVGSGVTSKIFLWDYVSDDISEVIDFGEGDLLVMGNLDGILFGISVVSSTYAITTKTVIRQYAGGTASIVKEIPYSALLQMQDKRNNKLFFSLSDGTSKAIWVIGRRAEGFPFSVTIDRLINGATTVTQLNALKFLGDYMFASMGTSGNIMRTSDQTAYSYYPYWISQKLNWGNLQKDKTLRYVNLTHVPLPASASLELQYRINSDTSWTSILTSDVDGASSKDATNQEGNNNRPFPSFKEIQFKIIATGLAEPISLFLQPVEDDSLLIETQ